jgi:hypothetical protein
VGLIVGLSIGLCAAIAIGVAIVNYFVVKRIKRKKNCVFVVIIGNASLELREGHYSDLASLVVLENVQKDVKIGEGHFGSVYKGNAGMAIN